MMLEKIIAEKKEEVARAMRVKPLGELKAEVRDLPPPRDFKEALQDRECAIIAEVKRQSPSRGILREPFHPIEIASLYEKHGAAAVSVLTDQPFFGGDTTYLSEIRRSVHIPLLRKDFIIDRYQIYETRVLGGDALLLIACLFDEDTLTDYRQLSESLKLPALVEVHSQDELDMALGAGATIIGINNRDLKTFSTDLKISLNLAPHIPADKQIVSESGIHSRSDIEILMEAGIHAFLIGEAFMRAENIGEKMRELSGA
jgi:indole-3-glycerol phosphate synthase